MVAMEFFFLGGATERFFLFWPLDQLAKLSLNYQMCTISLLLNSNLAAPLPEWLKSLIIYHSPLLDHLTTVGLSQAGVMIKPAFCICENKDADQLCGKPAADQRLCFCNVEIVQSLYFLNLKFQASTHLLWLYNPVCVKPGRKP